ncbi:MAG: uncharacterized protein JWM74_4084 [Myxococcaceae bacterium]|nr:uncharacterized protein [Myxococcaceae bacterium]
MGAYVDIAYVKLVGSMPAADIDAVEALYSGTFAGLAEAVSRLFDGRLMKRYDVPFVAPFPEALKLNVAYVVVAQLWKKRGFNPGSVQDDLIEKDRLEALAWLKEAADSKDGLVELPLRADKTATAVSAGGPMGYSETSPYSWTDIQKRDGRSEDGNGR